MNRFKEIAWLVILVALSAAPRLAGLGRFTSVDEPFWLRQSANFYYALGQRQFENTVYEYHPAVTTMWIVTAGMLVYFPQYRALGEGYLKPGKFDLFLPEHGKDPLQLLVDSRAVQIIVVVVLLVVVYLLLRLLFDQRSVFFATALISLSPFFLGHSRLLNHEAMLGLFILISLLGLLAYRYVERKFLLLLVSAISAALAQLSKSSGIVLFPVVALLLLIAAFGSQRQKLRASLFAAARTFGIWLLMMAAAYVLFWPGMWVAPGRMLSEVYGNALSYTFQGARMSVLPGLGLEPPDLGGLAAGLQFYLSDLIWRTTPVTWLGFVLGVGLAVFYQRRRQFLNLRLVVLYGLLMASAFVLLFGFQRGPKPPHYIVTSYVCIDLIAGIGIARAWDYLAERRPRLALAGIRWAALAAVLILQLASSLAFYPYYISYYNPLMEALQPGIQNPTLDVTGYGVGLDQAAAYLAKKPDAHELTVMSTSGAGCFSYYFPGHTVPMNNLTLSDPQIVAILRGSQYAVVDYYNEKRSNLAADLEGIAPEKIIWINGIEFIHIYRASDLLARVDHAAP
jgi:hypothetical protein